MCCTILILLMTSKVKTDQQDVEVKVFFCFKIICSSSKREFSAINSITLLNNNICMMCVHLQKLAIS